MMKKVLFSLISFLTLLILLNSCQNSKACSCQPKEDPKLTIDVKYSTGTYYKDIRYDTGDFEKENLYDWEDHAGVYKEDVVPDRDVALTVGIAVFKGIAKNSKSLEDFVPQSVFYDTENEFWVVIFYPDYDSDEGVYVVGGDCSIFIRKKDGQVFRICFSD